VTLIAWIGYESPSENVIVIWIGRTTKYNNVVVLLNALKFIKLD
jgi:hypothetical protein